MTGLNINENAIVGCVHYLTSLWKQSNISFKIVKILDYATETSLTPEERISDIFGLSLAIFVIFVVKSDSIKICLILIRNRKNINQ